jgi:small-conductance mechanosensitive channel
MRHSHAQHPITPFEATRAPVQVPQVFFYYNLTSLFMASDTEVETSRAAAAKDASAQELNAHTVHSFSEQAAIDSVPVNTVSPLAADEDPYEDEDVPIDFGEMFVKFLLKNTPFARAGRYMLSALLVAALGGILWYVNADMEIFSISSVPSHLICGAAVMFSYGLILTVLHSMVIFSHRRTALYNSQLLDWITEFEEYLAAGTLLGGLSVLFANLTSASSVIPPWSQVLFGKAKPHNHLRLSLAGLVIVILAAAKRHFMRKLAIEFNYSNYCDRVEECLFVERMLQSLMKARQAYRFRKKWKSFMTDSTPRKRTNGLTTQPRNDFVEVKFEDNLDLKSFSHHNSPDPQATPNSPQFAPITSPSSGKHNSNEAPASSSAPSSNAVKREQFEEFARLANKTAAQFDSLTVADIRVEIHREARRMAAQLFKWLAHAQRGDITFAELEPFIDNTDDTNRFLGLLRKQKKVNIENSASFTEGDVRRAIDSSLHERYGLAKSMETIEMALGKIDSILDTVLFILGIALTLLFLFEDVFKALAALSTLFFSATFVFENAAKNIFESIIFLLVIHPFDIGDRVFIKLDTGDNKAGGDATDNLVVVEMNLMSTVFERWDGVRVYVANSVLAQKIIYNIRRSGATLEVLKMSFGHGTSLEQLEKLRNALQTFLRQNRQDFTEFLRVNVDSLDRVNLINVTVLIQHTGNWQDMELQMARKTRALAFIKSTVDELGIHYELPKQRIRLLEHSPMVTDRNMDL